MKKKLLIVVSILLQTKTLLMYKKKKIVKYTVATQKKLIRHSKKAPFEFKQIVSMSKNAWATM